MNKFKFEDVVHKNKGFLRGPFGGDLKKEIFVPKNEETYKVYEQGVVLQRDESVGRYYITKEYFEKKMNRFEVKPKDFLVSCSGANYGAIFQLGENIEKGIINQALLRIRLNNNIISDNYFNYLFQHHIVNMIVGKKGDSTIPNFPPVSVIKELEFQLPNIDIQKKVGNFLKTIDTKIEINNKINSELEAMAKLIYDYWFVQFDFPNENGLPYKSSGGKMVYNKELKREIPEGWEVKKLGDCINIYDSLRVPLSRAEREKIEGTIPYYGATSVMGYVNDYLFDDDYILLAEDGSVMDEKGMPIVQFIWGKTWVNNHAHVIQAKNKFHNEFIYQLVKMIPVVLIKTGSIQMKINQENLNKHKVLCPSIELIEAYSVKANSIRKQLINNIEQNQKLSELRDWLLPMLMNGQVKVGAVEEKAQVVQPEARVLKKSVEKESQPFLKRKVLASYIINHSLDDNYFGNVKFEKLLHLADYHAIQRNFGQKYLQQAAGPYDNAFTYAFFTQVEKAKWFKRQNLGNLKKIVAGENHDKSTNTYNYFSDEELKKVDNLINKFKNSNYEQPEIVSTLYAVWNNRIIKQEPITDELLKQDFLKWDQQKAKYKDRLDDALQWMREENLVPNGWGPIIEKSKKK